MAIPNFITPLETSRGLDKVRVSQSHLHSSEFPTLYNQSTAMLTLRIKT